jgi:hypothetical protein
MSTATATATVKTPTEKKTYSLGPITLPALPTIDLDDARKPAYAWVGVADLVIEQVKEVPSDVKARTEKAQADAKARTKKLQESVPTQVKELPTQVKELPTTLKELPSKTVSTVKDLPAQAKKVRSSAQARFETASDKVTARYSDLAARGEKLVGQIRRQQSTQDAIAEGKRAVQKAEAAASNAKRAAKSAVKATEDAAETIG